MGICFITPLVPFAERQLINMIENREEIEWLNYWIEEANQEKNRICLIGDSTTRQYRKIMNRILQSEGYVVDLIAMSYSMLDDKLTEELVHYFEVLDINTNTLFYI